MHPVAFLTGAAVGATALFAAAMYDSKKTESLYSPLLKTPGKLDAPEIVTQLNAYFFKAQQLYSKCNDIVQESCELISTPIELPDDSLFQKAGNTVAGKLNGICRKMRAGQIMDLKIEAQKLYNRYKGVFLRANELVGSAGINQVDLECLKPGKEKFLINNSLENDDWDIELNNAADVIRDFLDNSCNTAEKFIGLLENNEQENTLYSKNR